MYIRKKESAPLVLVIWVIALWAGGLCFGQQFLKNRQCQSLSTWRFYKGELPPQSLNEVQMTEVSVPHTWNNEDVLTLGPRCYKGIGWYQTKIKLEKTDQSRRYFIRFEGAQTVADVYINSKYVGTHKGGYSAFCFEITSYVELDGENTIAVRVDNSFQLDVAPAGPNLYPLFGGIYRPVTLFSTGQVCISPLDFASAGVYIAQKKISVDSAQLEIKTLISNRSGTSSAIRVYTTVRDHQGGMIEQDIGLRSYAVDGKTGLTINGKYYDLYGVCRHQEWQGPATALSDKHHEKDIELILELGANGVRLAHYQQADKMYRLCDETGLVVWAEIPVDPPYMYDSPAYLENCKQQLTELIKQNFNHPSILFWGLYNEVEIPPGDLRQLNSLAKRLDPYRLTTQADYRAYSERHTITDIAGWNRYNGWYNANLAGTIPWLEEIHKTDPDLIIGISEYGAGGCITQQQENPERPDPLKGKFYPEQYQRIYHEAIWGDIKDRKDLWCKFIWNMFDFSWTIVHRGDTPYKNQKGLMTHDRKVKKDVFYFYKANWSDEPVLYIASRRNIQRKEELTSVVVYTNLDEVELFVNRNAVSKKKITSDIHKIQWQNIKLAPGRNHISVIGYKNNKKFTDSCEWTYSH